MAEFSDPPASWPVAHRSSAMVVCGVGIRRGVSVVLLAAFPRDAIVWPTSRSGGGGLSSRQMRGVWLVLSSVPLAVMLIVGVVTALALSEGANLWPVLLIFTAPVATAYLAVLRFVERRATRRDSDSP